MNFDPALYDTVRALLLIFPELVVLIKDLVVESGAGS